MNNINIKICCVKRTNSNSLNYIIQGNRIDFLRCCKNATKEMMNENAYQNLISGGKWSRMVQGHGSGWLLPCLKIKGNDLLDKLEFV